MHILYIPTFVPLASSHFNSFLSKLAGRAPEFLDPTFVAKADGREVTRVQSNGVVKIQLNIIVKDLKKLGYRYE